MFDDEQSQVITRAQEFAQTFPSLAHLECVKSWDAEALNRWACSGASHGEKVAAQFVLTVWNRHEEWECGKFDLFEAYGIWDDAQWTAFQAWAQKPFTL